MANLGILIERTLSISINRTRRRENYPLSVQRTPTQSFAVMSSHSLHKVDGANKIIFVIFKSLFLRLTHVFEGGKMNNSFKGAMLLKQLI